eukprot:gb/GECG01014559.1/.p1 GENE.gb/GECG01014559.1/~~gb/GECG01014559.1/.p1  ORF type:complete len:141 (+),score=12.46 gb/GECG01014559.1/:1-423(+)
MDLAHVSRGASIFSSTSYDPEHDANNIIDGDESTFWATTGMYPQEAIIQLGHEGVLSEFRVVVRNAKEVHLCVCPSTSPTSWHNVSTLELENNHGGPQIETVELNKPQRASYVRIRIARGHTDFSSVHTLSAIGEQYHHL